MSPMYTRPESHSGGIKERRPVAPDCKGGGHQDQHFHDVRGITAIQLPEAGCAVPEIAAITGTGCEALRIF